MKDLPLSKGNKGLEQYLIAQGIAIKTKIEYAKARDVNNQLTEWLNGDRVVFVQHFDEPLPRRAWIGDTGVRIFHRDQPNVSTKRCTNCHQDGHFRKQCTNPPSCIVCKQENHFPGDKSCSGSAKQQHKQVTTFAGKTDVLSNFYPCEVRVFGMVHKSAEHAYQFAKATQVGKDKVAERIFEAQTAFQAKTEASYLPFNPHWEDHKVKVMQDILSAKAKCSKEFCEALLSSHNVIAEAVPGDLFWSTGLNKTQCLSVKKSSWPGKNNMGKLLTKLRDNLLDANRKKARSNTRNTQNSSQASSTVNEESGAESEYCYDE